MSDSFLKEEKIDHYQLVNLLGQGGMGEIFLAFDTRCHRHVALKRIRQDMLKYPAMKKRFLKEAHLAARLAHPSIIPIYSIEQSHGLIYYTMPYIEGETLKQILRGAREEEKLGKIVHPIGKSIPALSRIFLSVCQAVSFAHSKGILHRDLKPENIMIGKFGEVQILDWGLAEPIDSLKGGEEELMEEIPEFSADLTRPGKVVGTLAFLPPERAFGKRADLHTDLYALGVLLYQILTLKLPFHRPNLVSFRKLAKYEQLDEPTLVSPYRDIPHQLVTIVKKALDSEPEKRYQSALEMISDLEKYIEGAPEWQKAAELSMETKGDWEFQENIPLTKHIAISRGAADLEWVNLRVSKESFAGNFRIVTKASLDPKGKGIGFLLGIEPTSKTILAEGYFFWIGSTENKGAILYHSNMEVGRAEELFLEKNPIEITIEKIDNSLRIYWDGRLILRHDSHLPLTGSRIGVLFRDLHFSLSKLSLFTGSQNVLVNCLCIPDAFFTHHLYDEALLEYRHISASFPGRQEGREAMFRAGFTLVEKALSQKKKKEQKALFAQALDEFSKLHATPGEPLEYLGKSLVYKALEEVDEEEKCLELALRKFPSHPLRPILVEHILHRLHEASIYNRHATSTFTLLALRYLPEFLSHHDHRRLISRLSLSLDPLAIFPPLLSPSLETEQTALILDLSFRLAKPLPLIETLEKMPLDLPKREKLLLQGFTALLYLGKHAWVQENLSLLPPSLADAFRVVLGKKSPLALLQTYCAQKELLAEEPLLYLLFVVQDEPAKALTLLPKLPPRFSPILLSFALFSDNLSIAKKLFSSIPKEELDNPSSPYFPLYGCYLAATKGEKAAKHHLSLLAESIIPPFSQLLSHYLMGEEQWFKRWEKKAFYWEKEALFQQLSLFYHCLKSPLEAVFTKKRRKMKVSIKT